MTRLDWGMLSVPVCRRFLIVNSMGPLAAMRAAKSAAHLRRVRRAREPRVRDAV